ncbi:Oligo-1,6-glucosidase 1 [compost metagenome]
MCYTFDLLGPDFTAAHIRRCVENFQKAVTDGWVCWAFSNHDVTRHVSRFARNEAERERVARLAIMLLSSLRGSICLYQGEELGLPEAELAFEDLRDPYGIRFWPSYKGRDGCRTPMVWEEAAANAGFTGGKPWLPVPAEHRRLAVDAMTEGADTVLGHYRATLAFRKSLPVLHDGAMHFLDSNSDLLAFVREKDGERLLFVFNLTREPQAFLAPAVVEPLDLPGYPARLEAGSIQVDGLSAFCGKL